MDNLKGSIKPFSVYHTDAYMIAVKNGFEGTEAEWLESLKMSPEEVDSAVADYLTKNPVAIDKTLTVSGEAADAKVTGEAISELQKTVEETVKTHVENKQNPHDVTAEQVGARPNDWMPTAQDVGARPNDWMPTAQDVGARPDTWTPTASEVGARPNTWMPTASQVGARPSTWMPTASDVGATPASHASNKSNPHGVTASQVGAVPTSRTVNGKALSSNVSLGASDVGAMSMKLLWTNASPGSEFAGQTISLDLKNYPFILLEYFGVAMSYRRQKIVARASELTQIYERFYNTDGNEEQYYVRNVTVTATGVTFGACYYNGVSTPGGHGNKPYRIFGIQYGG